jgi:pimeloyl-ACP methyl ester carboxylesterase
VKPPIVLEDGTRIVYLDVGQGDPIVYLHGAGGVFPKARFQYELGHEYRVLSPSRPGYDGSTGSTASARDEAEVMAAFIHQLYPAGGVVHLVAESAGAACGCWLAVLYPELIKSLVLVAPTVFATHRGPPPPPDRIETVLFGENPAWTEPLTAEDREQRQRNAQANAARSRAADGNQSLLNRLSEIKAPTLILWGSADEMVAPESGQVYKQRIPNSYRVYIYRAAHALPVSACAKFVQIATRFIQLGDAFVVNGT